MSVEAITVALLLFGGIAFLVWMVERCNHSWVLLKEIENIQIDESDESIRTITDIIYIHECVKCRKIKRQNVKVR